MEDDDSPHALALVALERQIIDLLREADAEGMTHSVSVVLAREMSEREIEREESAEPSLNRTSPSLSVPSPLAPLTKSSLVSLAPPPSLLTSATSPFTSSPKSSVARSALAGSLSSATFVAASEMERWTLRGISSLDLAARRMA